MQPNMKDKIFHTFRLAQMVGDKDTEQVLFVLVDAIERGYGDKLAAVCRREYERQTSHREHVEELGIEGGM